MECLGNSHIKFDFLGKDSIRYENEVAVRPRVYELVKEFCARGADGKREQAAMALTLPLRLSHVPHATA